MAFAQCIASLAAAEPAAPAARDSAAKSSAKPAEATAATPAAPHVEVSETDAPEAQGPAEQNSESPPQGPPAAASSQDADAKSADAKPAGPKLAGPKLADPKVVESKPAPPPVAKKETRLLGIRIPAFIALSVGGLGAGGAVVTRIASNWPSTDLKGACNGHCTDGAHTLQATSTILTGVAVAAVGTGVVLALSDPGHTRKQFATLPVLSMSVSPSKAAASASWHF